MTDKLEALGKRRIELLSSLDLDIQAISDLADEYAAIGAVANAEDLRARVVYYRSTDKSGLVS